MPNGQIDFAESMKILDEEVDLISLSSVNNVVGFKQDLRLLDQLRKKLCPRALIHIDHVQAWGKIKIDLHKSNIDLASFSAHKIHGPKAVGILYVKKNTPIEALIHGGKQQSLRSGTINMPGIVAMAKASRINEINLQENYKKVCELKKYLLDKLNSSSLDYVLHSDENCIPHIISLSIKALPAETIINALSEKSFYLGTQSACSKSRQGNYVLEALGKEKELSQSAIRISLGAEHNISDLEALVTTLENIVAKLLLKKEIN